MSGLRRGVREPSPDCTRSTRRKTRGKTFGKAAIMHVPHPLFHVPARLHRSRGPVPAPVCHVAYVGVAANPDANELARKAAFKIARGFKCGKDEVKRIGKSGRAIELATRR